MSSDQLLRDLDMLQIQLLSLDAGADQIFRLSLSNEPTEDEASVVDSASPVSSADAPKIEVVQPSAATPERGNLQPTQRKTISPTSAASHNVLADLSFEMEDDDFARVAVGSDDLHTSHLDISAAQVSSVAVSDGMAGISQPRVRGFSGLSSAPYVVVDDAVQQGAARPRGAAVSRADARVAEADLSSPGIIALRRLVIAPPRYRVVTACFDSFGRDDAAMVDKFVRALIMVFVHDSSLHSLLEYLIAKEVAATSDPATLFRLNSAATKLMAAYTKLVGRSYLASVLGPVVRSLVVDDSCCEVDPSKAPPGHDVAASRTQLVAVTQRLLDAIFASASTFPVGFRLICQSLRVSVGGKFPSELHPAVGGFVFLRYICPAVVAPQNFGIVQPSGLSPNITRTLVLVSKILQNLANGVKAIRKEPYLLPINEWYQSQLPRLQAFFEEVAQSVGFSDELAALEGHTVAPKAVHLAYKELSVLMQYKIDKIGRALAQQGSERDLSNESEKQGYVRLRVDTARAWRQYWCVLKAPHLHYFKSPLHSTAAGMIPLADAVVESSIASDDASLTPEECATSLSITTRFNSFWLLFESKSVRDDWNRDLAKLTARAGAPLAGSFQSLPPAHAGRGAGDDPRRVPAAASSPLASIVSTPVADSAPPSPSPSTAGSADESAASSKPPAALPLPADADGDGDPFAASSASSNSPPGVASVAVSGTSDTPSLLQRRAAFIETAVKKGYLVKQGGLVKHWQKRYFVLKGYELLYFKGPKDPSPKGSVDVSQSFVMCVDGGDRPFMLELRAAERVYYFECANDSDRRGWVDAIKKQKSDFWRLENALKQESARAERRSSASVGSSVATAPAAVTLVSAPTAISAALVPSGSGVSAEVHSSTSVSATSAGADGVSSSPASSGSGGSGGIGSSEPSSLGFSSNGQPSSFSKATSGRINSLMVRQTLQPSKRDALLALTNPEMDGFMKKQGATRRNWKMRWCVLRKGCLYYFKSPQDPTPAGVVHLDGAAIERGEEVSVKLNRSAVVEPVIFRFQILTSTRVYFFEVESRESQQQWIDALRRSVCAPEDGDATPTSVGAGSLSLVSAAVLSASSGQSGGGSGTLGGGVGSVGGSASSVRRGWLTKQGAKHSGPWRRRWVVLDGSLLMYYRTPDEAAPLGVIPLENVSVKLSDLERIGKRDCFEVFTRYRNYFFGANGTVDAIEWTEAIGAAAHRAAVAAFGAEAPEGTTGARDSDDGVHYFQELNHALALVMASK